jgi:hypothetical protein
MCGKSCIPIVDATSEERSGTIYSYKMPKGQMTQEQIDEWWDYLLVANDKLTQEQYKMVCRLHADLYAHPYHEPCTCSPKRIKEWIAQINKIYNAEKHT